MSENYDVIIVGGGVIGAAVLHQLSCKSPSKILLIEKSRFGQGSTGWSGGVIRIYHPDRVLEDMALESFHYFRYFNQHTHSNCHYQPCGFLYFVYPDQVLQAQREVAYLAATIPIEWLDKTQGAQRFPTIHWEDLGGAVFEPLAGYMDPVAVTQAWINAARTKGGTAFEGVRFDGLLKKANNLIGIKTNCGNFYAPQIVMCTGAWTPALQDVAQLEFTTKIQAKTIQLNIYQTKHTGNLHPAYVDPAHDLYGRAESLEQMYLGCPIPEWDINPDLTSEPDSAYMTLCHNLARPRFKWLNTAKPIGGLRRFDAYTTNKRGLVAASQTIPGLYWATGFSGGGFKLAPAVALQIQHLLKT